MPVRLDRELRFNEVLCNLSALDSGQPERICIARYALRKEL